MKSPFVDVPDAIEAIAGGEIIVVADDDDREAEGDLLTAAGLVTAEHINFMSTYGRGLVCLPLDGEILDRLEIPQMVSHNTSSMGTAFTVSIEARRGVTTGISTADRAKTIRVAADPRSLSEDLVMPGHVFPLRACPGGTLRRAGHTEAAVDLARLAGLEPAGVICEIMNDDGTMARVPELERFCKQHGLKMITIAQIIEYRRKHERLVCCAVEARLPTRFGEFRALVFENVVDDLTHLALVMGEPQAKDDVLVRVHAACLAGDAFHSLRCDCGQQLEAAMVRIAEEGEGVIVYMQQQDRSMGLTEKTKAYWLQEREGDTMQADQVPGFVSNLKDYGIGAQILKHLELSRIRVMTNSLTKIAGLEGFGIEIIERIPLELRPDGENARYVRTRGDDFDHVLEQWSREDKP